MTNTSKTHSFYQTLTIGLFFLGAKSSQRTIPRLDAFQTGQSLLDELWRRRPLVAWRTPAFSDRRIHIDRDAAVTHDQPCLILSVMQRDSKKVWQSSYHVQHTLGFPSWFSRSQHPVAVCIARVSGLVIRTSAARTVSPARPSLPRKAWAIPSRGARDRLGVEIKSH